MSKPENVQMKKAPALTRSYSSFLSVDAFYSKPSNATIAKQAALTVTVLFAIEYGVRLVLEEFQHMQPLLEKETNRLILARHIGTDWFCCVIVALLGISNFTTICPGFLDAARGKQGAMPRGGYESRMFTYQPASFRICMFFFCYQVKNMYDTILWQDGLIFVAHHLMCFLVVYGTIVHCVAHYHVPFYFGISELSTAFLCLLANFDEELGVPGLADAWPQGKVIFGLIFATTFITCRVLLWAFFSKYFVSDALLAINNTDSSRDAARPWVKIFLASLTGLSCLQVLWLGQIILVAKEELGGMLA